MSSKLGKDKETRESRGMKDAIITLDAEEGASGGITGVIRSALGGVAEAFLRKEKPRRVAWSRHPMLVPGNFTPEITLVKGIPKIIISLLAYRKIMLYISAAGRKEISWLGTVERVGKWFYVKDVLLVEQEVTAGNTILKAEGIYKLSQKLKDLPNGDEIFENLRFWGHFHPFGDATPSAGDEATMNQLFVNDEFDFFLRGICSNTGQIRFTLFLQKEGILVDDVPWSIDFIDADDDLRSRVASDVVEMVKEYVPPPPPPSRPASTHFGRTGRGFGGRVGDALDMLDRKAPCQSPVRPRLPRADESDEEDHGGDDGKKE